MVGLVGVHRAVGDGVVVGWVGRIVMVRVDDAVSGRAMIRVVVEVVRGVRGVRGVRVVRVVRVVGVAR